MRLTNNILLIAAAVMTAAATAGCDRFLDREPSKNSFKTITAAEQLDALLGTYTKFYCEYNHTALAGDDFGITTAIHDGYKGGIATNDLIHILWNDDCWAQDYYNLWSGEYEKLYFANLTLEYIDRVTGSDELKRRLKAEAHFLRAYGMFQLAVAYTLYYDGSNGSEPGLPLKHTISFEERLTRSSLEQTWAFIDADLHEALKSDAPYSTNGRRRTWRGTGLAAKAFAARYYLYRNDPQTAARYAGEVLAEYGQLKDFNTSMSFSDDYDEYNINDSTAPETVQVWFPYTKNWNYPDLFEWEEAIYARTCAYASWWYIPSRELLDCFAADAPGGDPKNDLRYEYFICEDHSLYLGSKDPALRYPGYCQFSYDELLSGPTVAEMVLIKAEAEARSGKWHEAMATVEPLRRARIRAEEYEAPAAASQAEALQFILRERRREMPFTMRWYDLKRLNANDDPTDDVTVVRTFYGYTQTAVLTNDPVRTYTLEPSSRHYATPIPATEIDLAKGALVQNRY